MDFAPAPTLAEFRTAAARYKHGMFSLPRGAGVRLAPPLHTLADDYEQTSLQDGVLRLWFRVVDMGGEGSRVPWAGSVIELFRGRTKSSMGSGTVLEVVHEAGAPTGVLWVQGVGNVAEALFGRARARE